MRKLQAMNPLFFTGYQNRNQKYGQSDCFSKRQWKWSTLLVRNFWTHFPYFRSGISFCSIAICVQSQSSVPITRASVFVNPLVIFGGHFCAIIVLIASIYDEEFVCWYVDFSHICVTCNIPLNVFSSSYSSLANFIIPLMFKGKNKWHKK